MNQIKQTGMDEDIVMKARERKKRGSTTQQEGCQAN
jgi:hypothetical protein